MVKLTHSLTKPSTKKNPVLWTSKIRISPQDTEVSIFTKLQVSNWSCRCARDVTSVLGVEVCLDVPGFNKKW